MALELCPHCHRPLVLANSQCARHPSIRMIKTRPPSHDVTRRSMHHDRSKRTVLPPPEFSEPLNKFASLTLEALAEYVRRATQISLDELRSQNRHEKVVLAKYIFIGGAIWGMKMSDKDVQEFLCKGHHWVYKSLPVVRARLATDLRFQHHFNMLVEMIPGAE